MTNETYKCYDCGSTIPNRHTPTCEMAEEGAKMDLPYVEGTQYWTESRAGKEWLRLDLRAIDPKSE